MLPDLNGKELEAIVKERAVEYKNMRLAHITACGVQAVRSKDEWMILQSLPDFEGVTAFATQFVFDCKVCSQASFGLSEYRADTKGSKSRQLKHMMERARYGVPCFFLMHWNSRAGATFSQPAETFLFPIDSTIEFWQAFERAETRSITRVDCQNYGVECKWNIYGKGWKLRPDILPPVLARIECGYWNEPEGVLSVG